MSLNKIIYGYCIIHIIPSCWERLKAGRTEDKMVGWHHRLDGHEFEQALGVSDGQGGLAAAVRGVTKSQTQLRD